MRPYNHHDIIKKEEQQKETNDKKKLLLKIIDLYPGIRYRELLRTTNLNNGTLSRYLANLENCSTIKVMRLNNSNIIRYYPASTPLEETIILGYLKIKTTKEIIIKLVEKKCCTFNEIVGHIDKAPSTTSWNLKRLMDSEVIIKRRETKVSEFSLKNPLEVERILEKNNIQLHRKIDNFTSLIEDL
jgi:predicted transcriptional regulator